MNTKPVFEADVVPEDLTIRPSDIAAEIRQASPPRTIYQPAPEWVTVEMGGKITFFPPDLPGAPLVVHPAFRENGKPVMVRANGTLDVRDKYGPVFDSKSRKIKPGIRLLKGETANDFLLFIGSSEKYQGAGFTWLHGDEKDEGRKKAAKARYQIARRKQAEQEVQSRAETVANFNKLPQNQGQTPPPPTQRQIEAQEFLDDIRAEGREGFDYVCRHGCAVQTNDFAKYARHMRVTHKETVEQETDVPEEIVVEKRKPGRPAKQKEAVA